MEYDNDNISNDELSTHGEDAYSEFNITGTVDVDNGNRIFVKLNKDY